MLIYALDGLQPDRLQYMQQNISVGGQVMHKRFSKWYEAYIGKIIPKYAFFSVIFCFVFNSLIYTGTQILMKNARHYDLSTSFDYNVPFIPGWIIVYVVCFAFWAVNYILVTRTGHDEWFKFATGDYLSRIVCMVFFVLLPTTNVRPEVTGNGFADNIVKFIYFVDPATNLFPSIHCLVSWMCYIGIRGRKIIPLWYRAFSCIFSIMVFLSTQFTKQHYIVDVIAGVIIAEVCLYIGKHTNFYKKAGNVFDKINYIVFGETSYDEEEEYGIF